MTKVFTVGVYDLLHRGHVELFRRASKLGDYLIVAVQDSREVLTYKPTANLINSTEDRVYMVNAIKYVDETIIYTAVDKIIKEVDFDIFVTGPDQIHNGFRNAISWCKEHGKNHLVLSRTEGISSTDIKKQFNH